MSRVKQTKLISAGILLMAIFLGGCDEYPTQVGEGILPDEDIVRIDTLILTEPVESFSVPFPIITGGVPNIFVGENDEISVRGIFRFDTVLTARGVTLDTILTAEVFDVSLFLEPRYYMGDSTETVHLSLYEVLSVWDPFGLTKETFEFIRRDSHPLATVTTTIGDTNSVEFKFPDATGRELMYRWALQAEQSIVPQGLIIEADGRSNGILGFGGSTADRPPRLRVIYGTGEEQDTVVLSQNARAFAASLKKDLDLHNQIVIQGGTSTRSIVRFDLSALPRGAHVHNARLTLTRNNDLSISNDFVQENIAAYQLIDPYKLSFRDRTNPSFSKEIIDTVQNVVTYTAQVGDIVQRWLTVDQNFGFFIKDENETLGFHRTSFFTEAADEQLRPRLMIIYSRL